MFRIVKKRLKFEVCENFIPTSYSPPPTPQQKEKEMSIFCAASIKWRGWWGFLLVDNNNLNMVVK